MITFDDIAIDIVREEQARQDAKWGEQNHHPGKWALILSEEMGEYSKAILEDQPGEALVESVQLVAVGLAAIGSQLRNLGVSLDTIQKEVYGE